MPLCLVEDMKKTGITELSVTPVGLVAGAGFEPTTSGLCVPLQLSLPGRASL